VEFRPKVNILTKEEISRAIARISHEILERNKGSKDLAIVGIRTRGYILAERVARAINQIDGAELPVGALDITFYRDDLSVVSEQPVVHNTEIDFDIEDKNIILVDDVLYTGRTIRCALDALIDFGRPKTIQLAVLIDRGHKELPIRADYVGKNLPTSQKELVQVRLEEVDGEDSVFIEEAQND
jgi:pyrimidine operon attenuation protein/uracil phosphoribosyltransferase